MRCSFKYTGVLLYNQSPSNDSKRTPMIGWADSSCWGKLNRPTSMSWSIKSPRWISACCHPTWTRTTFVFRLDQPNRCDNPCLKQNDRATQVIIEWTVVIIEWTLYTVDYIIALYSIARRRFWAPRADSSSLDWRRACAPGSGCPRSGRTNTERQRQGWSRLWKVPSFCRSANQKPVQWDSHDQSVQSVRLDRTSLP